MKRIIVYTEVLLLLAIIACKKDAVPEPTVYPYIITLEVQGNDSTGVTLNAKVIHYGEENITDYGFILEYDDNEYKFSLSDQSDLEHFQLRIKTNLEKGKQYSCRAFIQTNEHLVLANVKNFVSQGSFSAEIFDFSPSEGFDSIIIAIKGDNFGYTSDGVKAFINGTESKIEYFSNDSLEIRVPKMAFSGYADVTIKSGARTITAEKKFRLNGPEIESLSSTSGYSGDYLTISGKFFLKNGSNLNVLFNNKSAEIINKSDSRIDVIVPIPVDLLGDNQVVIKILNGLKFVSYNDYLIKTSWKRNRNTPFSASWSENFVACNDKGYFLFLNEKKLFEYDRISDYWYNISTFPGAITENSIYAGLGNKFFKIGGSTHLGGSTDFWEFDVLTRSWRQKNNIPFTFYSASCFELNGSLYIVTDKQQVWLYDENTDSFTQKNNFPEKLVFYITFIAQNKAYLVNPGKTWEYDAQSDSWTMKSLNPFQPTYNLNTTIGFSYKGTGYVLHGGTWIYRYDLLIENWILSSRLPDSQTSLDRSVFVSGNKAYIGTLDHFPGLYSYTN